MSETRNPLLRRHVERWLAERCRADYRRSDFAVTLHADFVAWATARYRRPYACDRLTLGGVLVALGHNVTPSLPRWRGIGLRTAGDDREPAQMAAA